MRPSSSVRVVASWVCAAALIAACGSERESKFPEDGLDAGDFPPTNAFGTADASGTGGPSNCKPLTCADQGIECGPAGDGCGGVIPDCGTCGSGLRCGGPNAPSKCVSPSTGTGCVPRTCADLGVQCGLAGDGCGGVITCGSCPAGQQCGVTGKPSQCVAATPTGPDGGACVPKTCADYKLEDMDCGQQSDGCGGVIDCGTCTAPEFCGGGGPSKCAVSGGGACVPKTCADYPGKCGPQPTGCGGVTEDCSSCTFPEICGGGGVPSVCGGGKVTSCTPLTTCPPNTCGPIADGCGGVLGCGGCTSPDVCGGGGVPNKCGGGNSCTPIPQATACAGMNCGYMPDGCGGLYTCGVGSGACPGGGVCGAYSPNVCGALTGPCKTTGDSCRDGADCCSGYCGSNLQCAATACIPDAPTPGACTSNAQCCSGLCSGGVCKSINGGACRIAGDGCTSSSQCCSNACVNGKCSGEVSFCTQKGEVCFQNSQCCSGNCVKTGTNQNGTCGETSSTAVGGCYVAGTVVTCTPGTPCTQSCCSRACGPTGGRNGKTVCQNPSGCHPEGELCQVDSDCCGWDPSVQPNGGPPMICVKKTSTDEYGRCGSGGGCVEPGGICKVGGADSCSTANNCCETLGQPPGQNCNSNPENCCRQDSLGIPRCLTRYVGDCSTPVPVGTPCATDAECCGNVCVPDVNDGGKLKCGGACVANGGSCTTTADCCGGACMKQPGAVAGTCTIPTCTPSTCAEQGLECGKTGDGCGNVLDCGSCPMGTTCGGGGVANKCGAPACTKRTSCPAGMNCGDYPDGCGGSIHCGECPAGQTCGGGGSSNVCGSAKCTPKSCAQQGAECGVVSDGCGAS